MFGTNDRRADALRQLPVVSSLALRLRDAGLPVELIAECLRVEPEAVGPLMMVAEAKLAALMGQAGVD
jgi:hypothetical protein